MPSTRALMMMLMVAFPLTLAACDDNSAGDNVGDAIDDAGDAVDDAADDIGDAADDAHDEIQDDLDNH